MPFLKVYGKSLYPSLASKATILFYLIIKNHPFVNGNKRIAVTTLMVFLMKNKKRLKAELQELHDLTIWVAESEPKDKNFILMATEQFIRKNMENFGD
jgi:death-on-curing family protein